MKTKRILSLLLTVAMIATCVTAFAAPEGYTEQSTTPGILNADGESITVDQANELLTDCALPILENVYMDVVATPITNADISEVYGYDPYVDLGCPEEWTDAGYLLKPTIYNIGTLSYKKISASKFGGLKLINVSFDVVYDTTMSGGGIVETFSDEYLEGPRNGGYSYEYSADSTKKMYPTSADEADITNLEDFASLIVFVEPGKQATISFDSVKVMYAYFDTTTGTQAILNKATVAPYHKASMTLGEAEEEVTKPTEPKVTAGALTGDVAINNSEDSYDNACMTSVTFTDITDITAVGILFIPTKLLAEDAELKLGTDKAKNAEVAKADFGSVIGIGDGSYTLNAALRGIPREYHEGISITSRAYAKYGTENLVKYADAQAAIIRFAATAE